MDQLYLLLDAGLYYDALEYLCQYGEPSSAEYLFYLGYIQAHLGLTEEAIQTLTKYKIKEKDTELMGTISGLLADIYHNKGMLFDAVSEISKALKVEPDCPLIKKKAEEIVDNFNDFSNGAILFVVFSQYLKRRLNYG